MEAPTRLPITSTSSGMPHRIRIADVGRPAMLALGLAVVAGCSSRSEPHRFAAEISRLEIPADAIVIEHREQWNRFLGDGYAAVTLQLSDAQFAALAARAERDGYRPFGLGGPRPAGLPFADSVSEGWYRVVRTRGDRTEASILDAQQRRILVRLTLL